MAKKETFIRSSWKGIDYIKSRHSGKYRLSSGSKESARMMQIASPMARQFRCLFKPILPFATNRVMQTSFVGAFTKWMKYRSENAGMPSHDLIYINHFQFNRHSAILDRLHLPLHVSWHESTGLLLEIPALVPALQVGAPAYTTSVSCTIMAGCCTLATPAAIDSCSIEFVMPYENTIVPARSVPLPLNMPAKSISLVAIAFHYTKDKNGVISVSKDKRWLPCGVVGGWVRE